MEVSTLDASRVDEAQQLVKLAAAMAPVSGIFVMSLAMNDSLLSSMVMNVVALQCADVDTSGCSMFSPNFWVLEAYDMHEWLMLRSQRFFPWESENPHLLPLLSFLGASR